MIRRQSHRSISQEGRVDAEVDVDKVDELLKNGQDQGLQNKEVPLEGEQDKEEENTDKKDAELNQEIKIEHAESGRPAQEEDTTKRNV